MISNDPPKRKHGEKLKNNGAAKTPSTLQLFVALLLIGVVFLGAVTIITRAFYWTFNVAPPPATVSAYAIPTAKPTSSVYVQAVSLWDTWPSLTTVEALALRTQRNVVNLAILNGDGQVKYLNISIAFAKESPWVESLRPPNMESKTVTGTSVSIRMQGWKNPVTVNVLQPFVLGELHKVYIVNLDGLLWVADATQLKYQPVETVQAQLPQELAANPNLSIDLAH